MTHRVSVALPARQPFDASGAFAFLADRAVAGIEVGTSTSYRRSMRLAGGHAVVSVTGAPTGPDVEVRATAAGDVDDAVGRIGRVFDVDADPEAIDGVLGADPLFAPLVAALPGLRVPGSVDPFETVIRAVVGQQVSVAGARTVLGRLVAMAGDPLDVDLATPQVMVFPTPQATAELAASAVVRLPMPTRRQATIATVSARVADGTIVLDRTNPHGARAALLDVPGIGQWTADYVAMRALGDRDAFLPTDLGVIKGLAALGVTAERAQRWRPWRAYAVHHLWRLASSTR